MLTRSDYMLHTNRNDNNQQSLKQVEFNTIAAGCPGTTSIVPSLHRSVVSNLKVTKVMRTIYLYRWFKCYIAIFDK